MFILLDGRNRIVTRSENLARAKRFVETCEDKSIIIVDEIDSTEYLFTKGEWVNN